MLSEIVPVNIYYRCDLITAIMPGQLPKNFRKGHLAEDIGISFLRNFCAVAQIRQEDDTGIDAVATLLRMEGISLHAEESFLVQIKSSSVQEITFNKPQIDWLLNLKLPLFILTVNSIEGEICLYTTNPIYKLFVYPTESLTIKLFEESDKIGERLSINDKHAEIAIGPPILTVNELESRSDEMCLKLYSLLKEWVVTEIGQIGLRKLNRAQLASWKSWEKPEYKSTVSSGSSENLKRDMEIIKPYIEYLSNHVFFHDGEHMAAESFLLLHEWFKENDVDLDVDEDVLKTKLK